MPSLAPDSPLASFLATGPLGIEALRPAALVSFTAYPLIGGSVISLAINALVFVALSLTRQMNPLERTQGAIFIGADAIGKPQAFRLWRASATVGDLEATVARYLGAQRARRAFEAFYDEHAGTAERQLGG